MRNIISGPFYFYNQLYLPHVFQVYQRDHYLQEICPERVRSKKRRVLRAGGNPYKIRKERIPLRRGAIFPFQAEGRGLKGINAIILDESDKGIWLTYQGYLLHSIQ
jgi:hypothetical protein